MDFNLMLQPLRKYAVFQGRARRAEYWLFYLLVIVIAVILGAADGVTGTVSPQAGLGLLSGIFSLAILVPSLALSFRRLHDTNRSAWWLLIALIPLIGGLVLFVFTCLPGTKGPNRYGDDPKAPSLAETFA